MSNFYTQHGWQGENYSPDLTLKEIAQKTRAKLKKRFPNCKFSVTTKYFSGGREMSVRLMAGPFEAATHHIDGAFNPSWDRKLVPFSGHAQLNENVFSEEYDDGNSNGTLLTKECWDVLKKVTDYVGSFRYDDCDGMIDYFNVNFWFHLSIGKWDRKYIKTS